MIKTLDAANSPAISVPVKAKIIESAGVSYLKYQCPGCTAATHGYVRFHVIPFTGNRGWSFNGTAEVPTLSPSILSRGNYADKEWKVWNKDYVCHHFVQAGRIQFLGDCTHELKGQTVDLPDFVEEPQEVD